MPFTDGKWIVARGVINGDPPSWLRQYHTKASLGFWDVHSTPHINGSTRITRAIVEEISLLRDLTPAEPLAEVTLLRRTKEPEPVVFYGGELIRRPNVGQVLGVR